MTKSNLQRVLIVDASKLVRVSLAKYLQGHFEVIEDADGESAWQTLVLDSSLVAVISGAKLPVLDAVGLVERMRENRLCRLNRMPFFMLASDSFSNDELKAARLCGVSDFIPKGMAGPEINALLKRFVDQLPLVQNRRPEEAPPASGYTGAGSLIGATDIMGQVARLAGMPDVSVEEAERVKSERRFLDRHGIAWHLKDLLPTYAPASPVGVLVFGLDGFDILSSRFGKELAQRITQKISTMLADKIRAEDSIGFLLPGRIAIVAPQADIALCSGFASRVCKALAAAQISLRGQRLGMTLSVGIAALPDDGGPMSGQQLLDMATRRLEAAMRAGGNRVQAGDYAGVASASPQEFLLRLGDVLSGASPEILSACLGSAGLQVLPLLTQIEQTLQLGLPLEDLGRHLETLAKSEQVTF